MHYYKTYLALGDSYTIGESVPLYESFPYQTVQLLRKEKQYFQPPEIVAKTGWTSSELIEHLLQTKLNEQYDFVSILIGVNNQYRGLFITDFEKDINFLLNQAIHFTQNKTRQVLMLSIPDWGFTPFAKNKDQLAISKEIDAYNAVCANSAKKTGVQYINITDETRAEKNNVKALANDQLHYSCHTHLRWAEKITAIMLENNL